MPTRYALLGLAVLLTLPLVQAASDDHYLQPTVRIRYERSQDGALITGHGTAFGVDLSMFGVKSKKYLLSAAHNVLDDRGHPYNTLKIEINQGSRTYWSRCKVIAADPGMDLCLVEAGDEVPGLATLADADASVGTPIVLAGSPRGIPVDLFRGTLTRRFENGTIRSMAEVPFDHGDSGGPVFCGDTGKVIGVAVAGIPKNGDLDHNVGLFVPTIGICSFLETHCAAKLKFKKMPVVAATPKTDVAPVTATSAPVTENASAIANTPQVATPAAAQARTEEARPAAPLIMNLLVQKSLTAPAYVPPGTTPPAASAAAPAASVEPAVAAAAAGKAAPAVAERPVVQTTNLAQIVELEPLKRPAPITYVVQEGDSLGRIARKHNTTVKALLAMNPVRDPNHITVGMVLVLP